MYGLFSVLLQFLLTNKQKLQAMKEKIDVLEKCIDGMVSLFLQIYCDIWPNVINSCLYLDRKSKEENGREVDGGNEGTTRGKVYASDSHAWLVFWGHVLGPLVNIFGRRLRVDGALPADDNSWEVSDSDEDQEEEDRMLGDESKYYSGHLDEDSDRWRGVNLNLNLTNK